MAITGPISISASVGAGGANRAEDVRKVQEQLNAQMRPPREFLVVDGICGPKTRAAIRDFQRVVCGFAYPDGRVDVGQTTIAKLNDPSSEAIWAGAPNPTEPPGGGPVGPVDPVAKCCPDVATFEGSTTRANYFGFDDRTNLVATPGTDEYWEPATKAKSMNASKTHRDGARWVSVAVGRETEVEISFTGGGAGCRQNCTYEVTPASVADVVTTTVSGTGVAFKIKGKAEGEASLKVVCEGKDLGWFHIWCKRRATITVDIGAITTNRATAPAYSAGAIQTLLNDIYAQTLLRFVVNDIGVVDLSGANAVPALEAAETVAYTNGGADFVTSAAFLTTLNNATQARLMIDALANLSIYTPSAYQMFYYVPTTASPDAGGSVINIGASPGFCFFHDSSPAASHNSVAHELGHSLGLEHPLHNAAQDQFAAHMLASLNTAVVAKAATNTEPAIPAAAAAANVMANDPINLMGYWRNKRVRKPLRYHQWVKCKRS